MPREVVYIPIIARSKGLRKKEHGRRYYSWKRRLERLAESEPDMGVVSTTFKGPKQWVTDKRSRGAFERALERMLPDTRYAIKYELDQDGQGAHAHISAEFNHESVQLAITAEKRDDPMDGIRALEEMAHPVADKELKPQWGGLISPEGLESWAGYMAKETYDGGLPDTTDKGTRRRR